MNRLMACALAAAVVATLPKSAAAQGADETSRKVAGGGITAPGWVGKIDPQEARRGSTLADARFAKEGDTYHVTTGPATTYWNPANTASGDYTVSATFTEPKFMNLNDHPHPYGIVIAGNDMGTDNRRVPVLRGLRQRAVHHAWLRSGRLPDERPRGGAPMPPCTRPPAVGQAGRRRTSPCQVKGDKVSMRHQRHRRASYDKSQVVAAGKLKSTDGVYGIRFAHNTDGIVSNLKVTKP